MCQALEEIMKDTLDAKEAKGREEGREEGKIIGTVETYRDMGLDNNSIIKRLVEKYGLSRSKAEAYVLETA